MPRDLCGMNVRRDESLQSEFRGQTYHFCSDRCLATFEQDRRRSHNSWRMNNPRSRENAVESKTKGVSGLRRGTVCLMDD